MSIEDLINEGSMKDIHFDPNKLLTILLKKAILNDIQLKHTLFLLTDIKAKLDGNEENEQLKAASIEMKVILDTINEEYKQELLKIVNQISV